MIRTVQHNTVLINTADMYVYMHRGNYIFCCSW